MSVGTSLKGIFYNLATNLVNASYIQIIASVAVSVTVAKTLLDKFDEYLTEVQDNFKELKNQDFSDYLIAFISLSNLDKAFVIIVTAITFAMVWKFTYDLKPKSKISN